MSANPSRRRHAGLALLLTIPIACGDVLVTTTADENNGSLDPGLGAGTSLREAILHAADGSAITFAPALDGQTLLLTLGQITIGKNLSISGSSLATGVTVSGNHASRVFSVSSSKTVTLAALDLINGDVTGDGGAILNAGNLTLDRCELSGNEAGDGGGAIENSGTLTLTSCTLAGNTAAVGGGAIEHASGILTATNCTFSGNSADFGGAIDGDGSSTIRLYSCTVSANHATNDGGGIEETTGTLLLENTIVAGNSAADEGPDLKASGINTQAGVNLVSSTSGLGGGFSGITASPSLAALADNGGRTRTMLPLPGSLAIDAGGSTTLTVDQRGLARVVGAAVDIGAVEVQSATVTTTADSGPGSLRDVVAAAAAGATVTFAPSLDGQTLALTSPVVIDRDLVIDGSERVDLAISGSSASGIFTVNAGVSAELRGLVLQEGYRSSGGAIHNSGTLELDDCIIRDSDADVAGGGIYNAPGAMLEVTDCEILGNHTGDEGGGVFSEGNTVFIRCTIGNNRAGDDDFGSGGGIVSSGSLSLSDSNVASNHADSAGGGIISNGSLVMERCTVSGNRATDGSGGGLIVSGSGGTITASTFAQNTALGTGGAIFHGEGNLTLANSTLSGNASDYDHGGGIYTFATTALDSCTISANEAGEEGGGIYVANNGGSLLGLLSLKNSIVAGNEAFTSGPDLHGAIPTQAGVNLVGSIDGIVGPFTGLVAPLSDNGGPTLTMLPQAGSPAIDAGGSTTLTVDQRGLPRVVGAKTDIGAVEVQGSVVQPVWLDVLAYRNLGQTVITSSPSDIGNPDKVFDGNLGTLYRSAAVNPAFIQLAFTSARTINGFRVSFSSGGPYQWKVEAADNQADMDGKTGSWAELLPWQSATGDDLLHDQDLPAPATARIYKLVVQRLTDNYVHINEWGLHGPVTIGAIEVVPANLELPHPCSWSYKCKGWEAGGASYDLTGEVAWSSSNPDAATVATSGVVTTVAPGTTEIGAVFDGLVDHGNLTVFIQPETCEPVSLTIAEISPAGILLRSSPLASSSYQLQTSIDLIHWRNSGLVFSPAEDEHMIPHPGTPRFFFRLACDTSLEISSANEDATTVTLNWPPRPDAVLYKVYRDGSHVGSTVGRDGFFTDTGLAPGGSREYRVEAFNACNESLGISDPRVLATATSSRIRTRYRQLGIGFYPGGPDAGFPHVRTFFRHRNDFIRLASANTAILEPYGGDVIPIDATPPVLAGETMVDYVALVETPYPELGGKSIVDLVETGEVDVVNVVAFAGVGFAENALVGNKGRNVGGSGEQWPSYPARCSRSFFVNANSADSRTYDALAHCIEGIMSTGCDGHPEAWPRSDTYQIYTKNIADFTTLVPRNLHLFERFRLADQWNGTGPEAHASPGNGNCGSSHFPPNTRRDTDAGYQGDYAYFDSKTWQRYIECAADNWLAFPVLTGAPRKLNGYDYGAFNRYTEGDLAYGAAFGVSPALHPSFSTDAGSFHQWWFFHLPNNSGVSSGRLHNWWPYIFDLNVFDGSAVSYPVTGGPEIPQSFPPVAGEYGTEQAGTEWWGYWCSFTDFGPFGQVSAVTRDEAPDLVKEGDYSLRVLVDQESHHYNGRNDLRYPITRNARWNLGSLSEIGVSLKLGLNPGFVAGANPVIRLCTNGGNRIEFAPLKNGRYANHFLDPAFQSGGGWSTFEIPVGGNANWEVNVIGYIDPALNPAQQAAARQQLKQDILSEVNYVEVSVRSTGGRGQQVSFYLDGLEFR